MDIKNIFKKINIKEMAELEPRYLRIIIVFLIAALVVMFVAAVAVFSLTIRGQEQVLVPNVEGLELSQALIKLQEKELYPRISVRTSEKADTKGQILEQNPRPGSVVKAGRRIALVVSKGAIVDKIGNYVGQNVDELRISLQSQFGASRQLIVIKEPLAYTNNNAPSGTILSQIPAPETPVAGVTELQLVVSKGQAQEKLKVPNLAGLDFNGLYRVIEESGINFLVTMRAAEGKEKQGFVLTQLPAAGELVDPSEPVSLVCTNPAAVSGMVFGLFSVMLPEYPYPLALKVVVELPTGQKQQLLATKHPGKQFTLPYLVPEKSVLVLSVLDRVVIRKEVNN